MFPQPPNRGLPRGRLLCLSEHEIMQDVTQKEMTHGVLFPRLHVFFLDCVTFILSLRDKDSENHGQFPAASPAVSERVPQTGSLRSRH